MSVTGLAKQSSKIMYRVESNVLSSVMRMQALECIFLKAAMRVPKGAMPKGACVAI